MAKRIAINGFGRIGRLTLRNILNRSDIEVVAINDLTDTDMLAHLFKYDSSQGMYTGDVSVDGETILIDGKKIMSYAERDPAKLPWASMGIDVVLECTGIFRTYDAAHAHINAGAKRVVISAPGKGEGIQTIVLGVNDNALDPDALIFSNASCTTNCLAPVVKVLDELGGIVSAGMTTIHGYTGDQNIQDGPHSDWRRARAAAVNMIPTSTGAATAVGKVYPAVQGKIFAMAIRVPVITGSIVDFTCILNRTVTREEINARFKMASETDLKGILQYSEEELVSTDIIGNQYSSIFDSKLTSTHGNQVKVISWYDNETGYSARLADMCARVSELV
jgi:glyceraldehyde 3-phosphate dehydrogenase (phosphorylating)